ncbi:hypothetical protein FOC84_14935 [Achromobacter pestifer]|uniref:Uncharacterized protein n=1 Tax=Achromobacter pestifer TaxID=1353889 RepID=A0A7D4HTP2_9BURK|nr:hypothetical protein [Achromobacter pestifer]QKH36173.1 hypothetical protein FOC84_14935 [Achromobacter pestifer]
MEMLILSWEASSSRSTTISATRQDSGVATISAFANSKSIGAWRFTSDSIIILTGLFIYN